MTNQEEIKAAVENLREAQEQMREALNSIFNAQAAIRRIEGGSTTAERLKRYIQGHLEPLIDSEHQWLDNSTSVENIIEEVERLSCEEEEEEEC